MARGWLVAVATLVIVCAPSTAAASQVSIDAATGGTTFTAGPGENNRLSIRPTTIDDDGDTGTPEVHVIEFTDYGSTMTITDGQRCRVIFDGNVVYCRYVPGEFPPSTIALGDGNDELRQSTAGRPETVTGGPGDDILIGGAGDDVIDGGPGNDTISENHGCVDTYDNGVGSDTISGGDGVDTLEFGCRTAALSVTLNGAADDGESGERDNVAGDVEVFEGGDGFFSFVGDSGSQIFRGGGGGNEADGGGGDDEIYGGVDDDVLRGGAGDDTVEGYGGGDTVDGGPGMDDLSGEGGSTITDGTGGADTILARDGFRDTVSCGSRADQAQVDQLDIVAESGGSDTCEVVDRANVGPPAPEDPDAPGGPSLGLTGRAAAVKKNGFGLVLTCRAQEDCFGATSVRTAAKLALKPKAARKRHRVGAALVSLPAGATRTVRVRLNAAGRKLLRSRRTLKVVVTLALTNAGARTTTATITLKR